MYKKKIKNDHLWSNHLIFVSGSLRPCGQHPREPRETDKLPGDSVVKLPIPYARTSIIHLGLN